MSPRDSRLGAVPETAIAVLDSDMHHVREQADIDRRTEAAFRLETRQQLAQLVTTQATTAAQLARVSDLVNRIEVASISNGKVLTSVCNEMAERRGGLRMVGAAVVLVPVAVELIRHLVSR